MERTICNLQYVCKNKTPFNTGLNNDIKDVIAILADKDYQKVVIDSTSTQDSQ